MKQQDKKQIKIPTSYKSINKIFQLRDYINQEYSFHSSQNLDLQSQNNLSFTNFQQQDRIVNLLKKPNRNIHDIKQIQEATNHLSYFQQHNTKSDKKQNNLHFKICKNLRFQYVPKGKIIFYQSAPPDNLYIILKGNALVLQKKSNEYLSNEKKSGFIEPAFQQCEGINIKRLMRIRSFQKKTKLLINTLIFIRLSQQHLKIQTQQTICNQNNNLENSELDICKQQIQTNQQQLQQQQLSVQAATSSGKIIKLVNMYSNNSYMYSKYQILKKAVSDNFERLDLDCLENPQYFFLQTTFCLQLLKVIEEGEGFGELGLLNNMPRAATIVALTDCQLATLSAKNYQNTLLSIDQEKMDKKISIIRPMIIENIQRISNERMSKISLFFTKVKFQIGNIIQKQNEKISQIYLLYKGEVELFKEKELVLDVDTQSSQNVNNDNQDNVDVDCQAILNSKAFNKPNYAKSNELNHQQQIISQQMQWFQKGRNIRIGIIGSDNFLGEECLFSNKLSTYTAVAKSDKVSIYQISKGNMVRLIIEYPLIENFLKKKLQAKQLWYNQRIIEDQHLRMSFSDKLFSLYKKKNNQVTIRVSEKDYKQENKINISCKDPPIINNGGQQSLHQITCNPCTDQQNNVNENSNKLQQQQKQQQPPGSASTNTRKKQYNKCIQIPKFNPQLIDIVKQNQKILKSKGSKINIQDLYKYTREVCNMKKDFQQKISYPKQQFQIKNEQINIVATSPTLQDEIQQQIQGYSQMQGIQTETIHRIMEKLSLDSIRPISAFKIRQSVIHIKSNQQPQPQPKQIIFRNTEQYLQVKQQYISPRPQLDQNYQQQDQCGQDLKLCINQQAQQQLDIKQQNSIMHSIQSSNSTGDILSFHQFSNSRFSKSSEMKHRKFVKSQNFKYNQSRNESRSLMSQQTLEDVQGISLQNSPNQKQKQQTLQKQKLNQIIQSSIQSSQLLNKYLQRQTTSQKDLFRQNQHNQQKSFNQQKLTVLDHMRRPIRFISDNNLNLLSRNFTYTSSDC